jgi:hypothetical protein
LAAMVTWPAPPICALSASAKVSPSNRRDGRTHPHELRKDETGRTGTDEEHLGAEGHLELVHTVDSARGGLEKGRLLVRQVLDLVALGEVAGGESAWSSSRFGGARRLGRGDEWHRWLTT